MNIQPFGGVTKKQIAMIEQEYSITLPLAYKKFLMSVGGGCVELDDKNSILIPDLQEKVAVEVLYGYGIQEKNADLSTYMDMLADDLWDNTVIIGDSIEHGLFVLIGEDGENDDAGAVYYWDDSYVFDQSDDENNTYWVADSFTEFLQMLNGETN